jgi:alkylated DNA repair dioxygenase AlkB
MAAGPHSGGPSQLRLFERAESKLDTSFAGLRRIELDRTSWVEHCSGWLSRNEELLEALAEHAGWEQRNRWMFTKWVVEPRLTAEYPKLSDVPVPLLQEIAALLSEHYLVSYDSAWLNLYRDHRDSTSWHADRNIKRADSIVPVLSLGDTRRFVIRPRDGGPSTVFRAEGGDLIVMGGQCQKDWVHCVPKETRRANMRISVNFGSSEQGTYR